MVAKRNLSLQLRCTVCGKHFHPWAGREQTTKVCSLKCNGAHSGAKNSNTDADFESYYKKSSDGCWNWIGPIRWNGYGLWHVNQTKSLAHRASYERYIGPIPEGLVVCHACDNRKCVNPNHLWVGSQADNLADMRRKGRAHKGPSVHSEHHPLSKINVKIARKIRFDKRNAREIAEQYGVSRSLVYGIKAGTHWKYA